MSLSNPQSTLTTAELAVLANFRRELGDALDDALSDAGAGGASIAQISVKDAPYSAVGDGVADDTAAIQAAFDAAILAGSDLVFPPGEYLITSQISITCPNGMKVLGFGRRSNIVWDSTSFDLWRIETGSKDVHFERLSFEGDPEEDYVINLYAALYVVNSTDVTVRDCWFEHCGKPVSSVDSYATRRLRVLHCVMHNCVNGLNPSSDSTIQDCDFIADSVVTTRAQAIYSFGQQINVQILNCRFVNNYKEAIQIRAGNPRFRERDTFRIEGCHFENCNSYAVWVGSDDHPDIGAATVIVGNTFKNCLGAVQAQGCRSAVITGNHIEIDWEFPFALAAANGIVVTGGVGLSGHLQSAQSCVVANNKLIVRHPFVGKVQLTALPVDGDTITIDEFTYTWKDTPASPFDVQIASGGPLATLIAVSIDNLRSTVAGLDGLASAPNPVLRFVTDAMCNVYGASYGLTDYDTLVVVGWRDFTMSHTGSGVTLTQAEDYRQMLGYPIYVTGVIGPHIQGNSMDDCGVMLLQGNYAPRVLDNALLTHNIPAMVQATSNVWSEYRGNRIKQMRKASPAKHQYNIIDDGFAHIEDTHLVGQRLTYPQLGGARSGLIDVGDRKAHTYLYYGEEVLVPSSSATLPYRWEDGDEVALYSGAFSRFYFKRSSPGAGEFSTADELITLINATGTFSAAYADWNNPLGTDSNPKKMIKIWITVAGAVVPTDTQFTVFRYKYPGDTVTFETIPQPLTVAQYRHTVDPADPYAYLTYFYGGYAAATKTFVHTHLADSERPITVHGFDATSQALNPVVYQADIVPGVGFAITHGAAAGTEKFYWHVS